MIMFMNTTLYQFAVLKPEEKNKPKPNNATLYIAEPIPSEEDWDTFFAQHEAMFVEMGRKALADYEAGRTRLLDPETM